MTRSVLTGTTLLLCCYSLADAQTDDCTATANAAKIAEVGMFSNMRYIKEHAYGYSVILWRSGNCLFGVFESSEGLAGDTPIGELQDVKYDSKTAKLSFAAKLTMGLVSFKGSSGLEQSRDLFTFDGYLKAMTVTGVVTHRIQNNPNLKAIHSKVVLRISKRESEFMHNSTTYGEWREKWQPVLRFRGPKW